MRMAVSMLVCSLVVCAAVSTAHQPSQRTLDERIDAIQAKVRARVLDSASSSPWSILHAMIGLGDQAMIDDDARSERVDAVTYLLTRATHDGRPIFVEVDGAPTLQMHQRVQHHPNQYLMGLALSEVPLSRTLVADTGRRFTLADLFAAARRDFEEEQEPGWTLVALSSYGGCDQRWTTAAGDEWTIERIVALAIERDARREAEGGTHHLFGVAWAVSHCGLDTGVWPQAREYLRTYVGLAKAFQQDDGAFSGALYEKSAPPRSPSDLVFSTGHSLEWLTYAVPPAELSQDWIRRAAERLCAEIENHPVSAFSDGGIYHAVNALRRYRHAVESVESADR